MNKKELLRSLKFLLFSVSAGIIQLGGFALLNELLHLQYWLSYLIALVASVLWNFTFNRRYTFKSSENIGKAMLLVADEENLMLVSGTGEVIEADDGILAIGSGGNYALAAARALAQNTDLSAHEIAEKALHVAAEICVFTNNNIIVEDV